MADLSAAQRLTQRQGLNRSAFAATEVVNAAARAVPAVFEGYTSTGGMVRRGGDLLPAQIEPNGLLKRGQVVATTGDSGSIVVHGLTHVKRPDALKPKAKSLLKIKVAYVEALTAWKVGAYKPEPDFTKASESPEKLISFHNLGGKDWVAVFLKESSTAQVVTVYSDGRDIPILTLPVGGTLNVDRDWPGGGVLSSEVQTGYIYETIIDNSSYTGTSEFTKTSYVVQDGLLVGTYTVIRDNFASGIYGQRGSARGEIPIALDIVKPVNWRAFVVDRNPTALGVNEVFGFSGSVPTTVVSSRSAAILANGNIDSYGNLLPSGQTYSLVDESGEQVIPILDASIRDFPLALDKDTVYQVRQTDLALGSTFEYTDFYLQEKAVVRAFDLFSGAYSDAEYKIKQLPIPDGQSPDDVTLFDQSIARFHP